MYHIWWAGRDSNPRRLSQRIYSPPHLTALEPTHKKVRNQYITESNHDHSRLNNSYFLRYLVEPPIRLELMTAGLQNRCSTN